MTTKKERAAQRRAQNAIADIVRAVTTKNFSHCVSQYGNADIGGIRAEVIAGRCSLDDAKALDVFFSVKHFALIHNEANKTAPRSDSEVSNHRNPYMD